MRDTFVSWPQFEEKQSQLSSDFAQIMLLIQDKHDELFSSLAVLGDRQRQQIDSLEAQVEAVKIEHNKSLEATAALAKAYEVRLSQFEACYSKHDRVMETTTAGV